MNINTISDGLASATDGWTICAKGPKPMPVMLVRRNNTCTARVTSGKQDLMVMFKDTGNSATLKLFRPMFAEKDIAKNNIKTPLCQVRSLPGDHRQRVGHRASMAMPNATKDSTCWTAVIRKPAGTPCKPSSRQISVSDRRNFMYKLNPVFTPKYKRIRAEIRLSIIHKANPMTMAPMTTMDCKFSACKEGPRRGKRSPAAPTVHDATASGVEKPAGPSGGACAAVSCGGMRITAKAARSARPPTNGSANGEVAALSSAAATSAAAPPAAI
mmetsp:Transcript_86113/g.263565  ORF Transcript_86113/g.263565 Transcript_86113/m.263565 type:complete len:271 (-) Transcript_86113:175-987(-)